MSIRHVRAVQEYSAISDDLTRHILEIIALDIGIDDSPAYTSYRKIAQRARCAVNTARDRIQDAIDSGELLAAKDGKYMFYRLNQNQLPYGRIAEPENGGKVNDSTFATTEDLEELYQRLYQNSEELYQRLYQNIVSIVSTPQTGADPEVKKDKEKGEDKDPPPIRFLADTFQELTALSPNRQSWAVDWEPVLEKWAKMYGQAACGMIADAVKVARGDNGNGRNYTISSPRSLDTIMANIRTKNEAEVVTTAADGGIYV